jgi:hypothetical protein
MKQVLCGELAWLCCIPADKVEELRTITLSMTLPDLVELHEIVCSCAAPTNPSNPKDPKNPKSPKETPPNNPPEQQPSIEECLSDLANELCSPDNLFKVNAALIAIDLALKLPLAPTVEAALTLAKTMLTKVKTECAGDGFIVDSEMATLLCSAVKAIEDLEVPSLLQPVIGPVLDLLVDSNLAAQISNCCAE